MKSRAIFLGVLFFLGILFVPGASFAQQSEILQGGKDGESIEDVVTKETNLGKSNLEDSAIMVIDIFLGILSLIAVILIIYGGFVWMTSAGNQDKVQSAQDILKAATIGLVVIMASWAITLYIIRYTTLATKIPSYGSIERYISYEHIP